MRRRSTTNRKPLLWGAIPAEYKCVDWGYRNFCTFGDGVRGIYYVTKKGPDFYSPDGETFMVSQDRGKFWVVLNKIGNEDTLLSISIYANPKNTKKYSKNINKYLNAMKIFKTPPPSPVEGEKCRKCCNIIIGESCHDNFPLCQFCVNEINYYYSM